MVGHGALLDRRARDSFKNICKCVHSRCLIKLNDSPIPASGSAIVALPAVDAQAIIPELRDRCAYLLVLD